MALVIAEPEDAVRADLAQLLGTEGFEVVGETAKGDRAVALASDLRPDLVLMNAHLADHDGTSPVRAITAGQIAPVLILTSGEQPAAVERIRQSGAMSAVRRPFSRSNLLPAIELSIARHADTAALQRQLSDLTDRLATRKVIDRAKGMLMASRGISASQAFRWLQDTAIDHHTSILQVATAIIDRHQPAADLTRIAGETAAPTRAPGQGNPVAAHRRPGPAHRPSREVVDAGLSRPGRPGPRAGS